MRLLLASPGSFKRKAEKELYQSYIEKIGWPFELKEIPQSRQKLPDKIKQEESAGILKAISGSEIVVALDIKGKELSSPELARLIEKWQIDGIKKAAFVIGGAEGIGEEVLKRANHRISFGKATWPHLLCRVMLAEQLYRAWTILGNHPYHRE